LVPGRARPCVGRDKLFGSKTLMRFGIYLMVAAFIIMGAEVAYALYQLANLVL
jgi:hypothetical protein